MNNHQKIVESIKKLITTKIAKKDAEEIAQQMEAELEKAEENVVHALHAVLGNRASTWGVVYQGRRYRIDGGTSELLVVDDKTEYLTENGK